MTDLLNRLRASFNMGDKTKVDKKIIILIILVCLFVLYVDFSYFIKTQLKGIKTLGPQIIKLKNDISNLNKDLSMMEDAKKGQLGNKKQTGVPKFKQLISEDGLPQLLKEIADIAKDKVKIMQINTASDKKVKEEVISGSKFSPILITLNLSCNYHSLGSFINALENMQTFLSVEEIEIVRDAKDYLQQRVELVLKTYAKK